MAGMLDRPVLDPGSHLCWVFDDDVALRDAVVEFVADGIDRNERVVYVGSAPADELLADLADLDGVESLVAAGALSTRSVSTLYRPGDRFDRRRQLAVYREATEAALGDGFTGFRVAADATALAAGDDRPEFLRYEFLVDRLMTSMPMTAMCAYDRRVLGETTSELCAVHPVLHADVVEAAGFGAYHDGDRVRFRGDIDIASASVFREVAALLLGLPDETVGVDLSAVTFMDVASLRRLGQLATELREGGRRLTLSGMDPTTARCAAILGHADLVDAIAAGGA
jgi:anti-anti-sigma factor